MQIFLDACAIIYWIEMTSPEYEKFAIFLQQLRKQYHDPELAVSALSLLECRVKPLREQNEACLRLYQQFFCATDLCVIPLSFAVLEQATMLRAHYLLRTPDAIQAASALSIEEGAVFVTGDRAFKKIPHLKLALF